MSYQGHMPDGSSVQRHSAGATYPFIVVITKAAAKVRTPSGDDVARYPILDATLPAARMTAYQAAIDQAAMLAADWRSARAAA